jgi:hypothetical protein
MWSAGFAAWLEVKGQPTQWLSPLQAAAVKDLMEEEGRAADCLTCADDGVYFVDPLGYREILPLLHLPAIHNAIGEYDADREEYREVLDDGQTFPPAPPWRLCDS